MEFVIFLTLFILITLLLKNYYKEKFSLIDVDTSFKNKFIDNISNSLYGNIEYRDNIVIKKLKNSSKIIVYNINLLNNLSEGSIFNRNMNYISYKDENNIEKKRLKYNLQESEHKNNIYSGYYITNPIKTNKKNKNYGFIFEYNPIEYNHITNPNENGKEYNNFAEISIDFQKSKQKQINNIQKIDEKYKSKIYRNIKRKTVNVFTSLSTPLDIMPYFNKGDNDKNTKIVILFYDQVNYDFIKSFPNGRFNILDTKLNTIISNCKIDTPYCNISLKRQKRILGREKFILGKFNPKLNKYTVYDTDEYHNYKKNLLK